MKSLGLWFIFKINGNLYAIDCAYVDFIGFIGENELTRIADASDSVKGIFKSNGKIVTLLNLRKILGFTCVSEERQRFLSDVEDIKKDCETMSEALKKAVEKRERFTLSIDSFKHKFDEWYDYIESKQSSIIFQLLKIDEIYVKINDFAETYNKIYEIKDDSFEQKAREILNNITNICIPEIESIFKETKNIFRNMIRENFMCINEKTVSAAFAIDEIVGIEKLEIISDANESEYLSKVAKDKKDDIIMIVDVVKVLEFADNVIDKDKKANV